MKNRYCFLSLFFLSLSFAASAQGVGVGTTTPAASAALDVTSTSKGLLLPRMTAAQRAAIVGPVAGLFVFQTDGTQGLYYYNNTTWVNQLSGLAPDANGSTARVTTLAGGGSGGSSGPDGTGTAAQFSYPSGVSLDGIGSLYVADYGLGRIRKIVVATGVVTSLAGYSNGYADGTGTAAKFYNPTGVAADGSGNVYVADNHNNRIRKVVIATGVVTTLAGSGTAGSLDGTGTAAQFSSPYDLTADGSGNLYVTDEYNHRIRKIVVATGVVTTFAGSGTAGTLDGTGTAAQFNNPAGVAADASGNLYVCDMANNRIRKIVVATGVVTTLAGSTSGYADGIGTAAQFYFPQYVCADTFGNVFVSDGNNRIRKIVVATGVVTTLAGSGTAGNLDGPAAPAQFSRPAGVAVDDSGTVYVADQNNSRVRVIK